MQHKEIDTNSDIHFVKYLNQYRNEGIFFTIYNEHKFPVSKEISKEWKDSNEYSQIFSEQNEVIETEMCERFYLRMWETKKEKFCNSEIDFIESEINFLNSFSDKIKIDYDNKFTPLLSFLKSSKANNGFVLPNESKSKNSQPIVEPNNPFKRIFVNGFAYEFFEKLRSEIINNPKFALADYSFIMPKMIADNYLIETNGLKLIIFLDENYETTIGKKNIQFKTSETDNKKLIYSRLNKEYKSKINSIL